MRKLALPNAMRTRASGLGAVVENNIVECNVMESDRMSCCCVVMVILESVVGYALVTC